MIRRSRVHSLGLVWVCAAGAAAWGLVGCDPDGATTEPPEADVASETAPPASDADEDDELSPSERLAKKMAERRGDAGELPKVELDLRQMKSGHLVVPLEANGQQFGFILDTGASSSVITPRTREALGLGENDGMEVQAAGANGSVNNVRLMTVPEITVGPRVYKELSMAVMDLTHLETQLGEPIDGILGRNFLMRNDVEIDFVTKRINMYAPGAIDGGEVEMAQMQAVPYTRFPAGLMRIEVELDEGVKLPAVFDMGAARSVLNWRAAEATGLDRKKMPKSSKSEDLLGADDRAMKTFRHTFKRLATGTMVVETPELHIADLEVFETLGVADGPAMVFGLDMVRDRRVVIDYAGQRIFFSEAAGS